MFIWRYMFIRDLSPLSDDKNLNLTAYTGYDVKIDDSPNTKIRKKAMPASASKIQFLKECINF